jgi:histone acetyltransferase (RNA polymerase elongator complex component)
MSEERAMKDYVIGLLYPIVSDETVDYRQVAENLIELAKLAKRNKDIELQKIVLGHIAGIGVREYYRQNEVVEVSRKIAEFLKKSI